MVFLRADEHRYLLTAEGTDEAQALRIPGCRHVGAARALQLSRQPGVVLALDRIFGEGRWEHAPELAQEVVETRGRAVAPPQQRAAVTLSGNELAVECAFGDKELVKLVPGYRWSAPQRKWFLPAYPMTLELLGDYFGELLEVDEAVRRLLELKKVDEDAALQRAQARPVAAAATAVSPSDGPVVQPTAAGGDSSPPVQPDESLLSNGQSLGARLDRLATAVEELVGLLRINVGALGAQPVVPVTAADEPPAATETEPAPGDWRELLAGLDADPTETCARALRQAQTAGADSEPSLRAVAGLAMARMRQYEDSLGTLRRALERPGTVDPELEREATLAYVGAVVSLISDECGPQQGISSEADFQSALLSELVNDSGFDGARLGSAAARARLDYLVNDPVLRRVAPRLSDHCRIAHLLGVARGGQWMAANRITDILRERTLGDDGFALALILLANAIYDGSSLDDWDRAWPKEDISEALPDLSWLTQSALERLTALGGDNEIAEPAAIACLACIAGGPQEWASMSQRKSLVQFVALRHAGRRQYAEFLAGFQLARNGQKTVIGLFPGWVKVLAQWRLSGSAGYLMEVAANDQGGSGSLTWAMAEDVYLPALSLWGIADGQAELVDLLDLLEGGKRPDNYLNEAGRLVESTDLPWTRNVSRDQRKLLYERALDVSLKQGHDRDSVEAFDRLVRELRAEGDRAQLTTLCVRLSTGMRALRAPALEVLLSEQLESGEPFEDTADQLLRLAKPGEEADFEVHGLAAAFPRFAAFLKERADAAAPGTEPQVKPPNEGQKVVVVGGHQWLKKHALPVLEDQWRLKVDWLDPDSAKNGQQSLDLASGSADLIVINAACISHAASGRVIAEAKASNRQYVAHHSRGVGALLAFVNKSLAPATSEVRH
jgi:hypothetical protein